MSIPGLSDPIADGGRLLADGGILCNLPAAAARARGADLVVAIDLLGGKPELNQKHWGGRLDTVGALKRAFDVHLEVDMLIRPDVGSCSFADLSKVDWLIDQGRAAGEQALPVLRRRAIQSWRQQRQAVA